MFDLWSLIIGLIVGGFVGIAAMALPLLRYEKLPDDEPEYWLEQLGRRNSDKL